MNPLFYQIALKQLKGIGPAKARTVVSHFGGVKEVFEAKRKDFIGVAGLSKLMIEKLNLDEAQSIAEQEVLFIEKQGIRCLFYLDQDYPRRLTHCNDAPILLYTKGEMSLNPEKVVAIVGTRNMTEYGAKLLTELVRDLKGHNPLVISGLALGADIHAHREALKHGLQTVGVMGNSMDMIYPSQHTKTAHQMLENGGLITEFESGTKPDMGNFPMRNRIVAGMSDIVVVAETPVKGGSMITARLAADYNRDVAAFPGPVGATNSQGCHHLIKNNQAHLIEGIKDIEKLLGWDVQHTPKPTQTQLFLELDATEKKVYDYLNTKIKDSLDNISNGCKITVSQTSMVLLELEFKGVVQSLPGKVFRLL